MRTHLKTRSWLWLLLTLLFVSHAAAASGLSSLFGGGRSQPQVLPVEQAFPFSVDIVSPLEIRALWDSLEGYYLYRDKLRFELAGTEARIENTELPSGEAKDDPYFGRMEVLYGTAEARLTLDRPLAAAATLKAEYQGCADAGLCYPPQTIEYPLSATTGVASTPTGSAATGAAPAAITTPPTAGDPLSRLLGDGDLPLILAGFFAAGLLLSFTACLYPMIPILSGLIAGDRHRRTGRRAFMLSLVYVEASAITYAIAGVLAGLSGVAIQADLQSPWILGSFAALFVVLALSMFGLFTLQLPGSWQTRIAELSHRQRGGTVAGVAIMGALSSLIVGACSGPALIAALVFISNTGNAWLGGLALFVLANGMGLPLLLIGTAAGKWLPRSGPWMNTVRRLFGVGFLIVALWLIERLLPGHVALALWGALLLGCAVFLGAFDHLTTEADGNQRLRKFGGVLLLIWGSLLLLGAAAGSRDFWQPLHALQLAGTQSEQGPAFQPVKSVAELDSVLARARLAQQPVMIDVRADWCVYCVQLERNTFPDPAVRAALSGALLIKIDVTDMNPDDKALLDTLGVFLPPAVIFIGDDGRERADSRVVGFLPPEEFAPRARQALGTAL